MTSAIVGDHPASFLSSSDTFGSDSYLLVRLYSFILIMTA